MYLTSACCGGCFRFAGPRNKLCVDKTHQSSTNRELSMSWRAIGERNFEPTEWAKDERQGSARFSGRSPCNNKKLNGARSTGDRIEAMNQATALSPTPWALIIFYVPAGAASADALLPRPTIFRPLCGLKIPQATPARQTRIYRYGLMITTRNLCSLITSAGSGSYIYQPI